MPWSNINYHDLSHCVLVVAACSPLHCTWTLTNPWCALVVMNTIHEHATEKPTPVQSIPGGLSMKLVKGSPRPLKTAAARK